MGWALGYSSKQTKVLAHMEDIFWWDSSLALPLGYIPAKHSSPFHLATAARLCFHWRHQELGGFAACALELDGSV